MARERSSRELWRAKEMTVIFDTIAQSDLYTNYIKNPDVF